MRPWYHIWRGIGFFLLIILAGVIGYRVIEGWSFLDSLFMTIITLTTVGYGEVHPLSTAGKIFSIILIVGGVGSALYILTTLVPYLFETIETEFGIRFGRRRMETKIGKLENHFILCGYGRVGREIANMFRQEGIMFVVVDTDEKMVDKAVEAGYLSIQGDAMEDDVLRQVKIERARALIAALGSDADNAFLALTARGLKPDLHIIARAETEEGAKKLQRVGAGHIVSPYTIGARRMAMLAVRPTAVDFVETVLLSREQELLLEELEIQGDSALSRITTGEVEKRFPGMRILALRKNDGTLLPNPEPQTALKSGDRLVTFGSAQQLQDLENCCR